DVVQSAKKCFLTRDRSPADNCHRHVFSAASVDELLGDLAKVAHTHVDAESAVELGEFPKIDVQFVLRRVFMSGDEADGGGQLPVGEGDACISRGCKGGGDSGDNFERNVVLGEGHGFFSPATKNEGVSAFQAYHLFPGICVGDEDLLD